MSQPPEHPGNPHDPYGGNPNPRDYPPPPGYGPPPGPPPGYGPPPPGQPQPGYGPPPGYGAPPPPPPGYGPPPQPGYGPPPGYPPPPGYRPPPGYPAASGYGPPPGAGFNVGDAVGWAWEQFKKNIGPLVLAALIYALIGVVVHGLVFVLLGGATADTSGVDSDYGASFSAGLDAVGTLVLSVVSFVFGIFVQAAFLSGGLDLADGRPVTVSSFFKPRNFGTVVLAGALLSVISAVLELLSLPGVLFALLSFVLIAVFTFFAVFTIAFATDRALAPIDALKASFDTVRAHIGETLLSLLVQGLLVVAGFFACLVGILVTGPIALLVLVYTYRRLSGGPIAAPAP
ncbi:MAG TPA: hypothetical protein VGH54_24360 [Mycobacterium sp.]|uniref:hypothetical protein n=1 Tax=Mycobacterium sp. TaxID=1785 RepID=UPI002F40643C